MNQTRRSGYVSHWVLVEDSRQHRGARARDAREKVEGFVHEGILACGYVLAMPIGECCPDEIAVQEVSEPTCFGDE